MFNFTSLRNNYDNSCVIQAGEHPFVRHDTFVIYAQGKVVSLEMQKHMMANPAEAAPRQPVSAALLERIQLGALKSDFTPQKMQKAVQVSRAQQEAK